MTMVFNDFLELVRRVIRGLNFGILEPLGRWRNNEQSKTCTVLEPVNFSKERLPIAIRDRSRVSRTRFLGDWGWNV
jgi:hypothetical protein